MISGCKCEFHKFGDLLPLCGKPFNPDHPLTNHKGFACGNMTEDNDYCGHAETCHSPAPQTEPKGERQ